MLENTVYDKVYKTMLHDRPKWIILMINEVFREQYRGEERIEFLEGIHYIKDTDGKLVERATDSYFIVMDERRQAFHFEVQSTPDSTMVQRVYEYESAIAYKYRSMDGSNMIVHLPPSAVLFLRHTKSTPDVMRIVVETRNGAALQEVPVMKLGNYSMEKIFEKRLFILIPFYIFVYENKIIVYNSNKKRLEELKEVYGKIKEHLDMLVKRNKLDEYDRFLLINMTIKVVENLAEKFENVVKGVNEVMIGVGIDYPGRDIYYKGKEDGRKEGRSEGERKAYLAMFKDGLISLTEVAKRLNMSEEMVKTYL